MCTVGRVRAKTSGDVVDWIDSVGKALGAEGFLPFMSRGRAIRRSKTD